jgi:hypothetical protein
MLLKEKPTLREELSLQEVKFRNKTRSAISNKQLRAL